MSTAEQPEEENPSRKNTQKARKLWWEKVEESHVKLLVQATPEFIVWIDQSIDVDWMTNDSYKGIKDQTSQGKILNTVARLECIPNLHLNEESRLSFKRMLGEAIVRSLCYDYDGATEMCKNAEAFINQRNLEIARYWQLSVGCIGGALILIMAILTWHFRSALLAHYSLNFLLILMACFSGAIGAVLSMILRIGNSLPTAEAPKKLHITEAASRLLAGSISGVIVTICVRLGLVFSVLTQKGELISAVVLAAIVGGLSERYVPSLVELLEKQSLPPSKKSRKISNSKT